MPTQIFTWTPDYGVEKEVTATVAEAKFGDGYTQRARFGVNTQQESWSATFSSRTIAECDAIEAFLRSHYGVNYFMWPHPSDPTNVAKQIKVVCGKWKRSCSSFDRDTISMTLTQVFDF